MRLLLGRRVRAYVMMIVALSPALTACGNKTPTDLAGFVPGFGVIGRIGTIRASAVSAGKDFSLALDWNGKVWAWGDNQYGQLGTASNDTCGESATPCSKAPVQVPIPSKVIQIAAGDRHGLAIASDPTDLSQLEIWAWGDNLFGQLGDGTLTPRPRPVKLNIDFNPRGELEAGAWHTVLRMTDGPVYEWGSHIIYTTEDSPCVIAPEPGPVMCSLTPTLIPDLTASDAAAGGLDTLTVRPSVAAVSFCAWGANEFGGVGSTPGPVVRPLCNHFASQPMSSPSAGGGFSVAMSRAQTALTWGLDDHLQLGYSLNGASACAGKPCSVVPGEVTDSTGTATVWSALDAGGAHVLGLSAGGGVMAWGSDENGQIGNDTVSGSGGTLMVPVQTLNDKGDPVSLVHITSVSAGGSHSLAVNDIGSVLSWGDNTYGQLGR